MSRKAGIACLTVFMIYAGLFFETPAATADTLPDPIPITILYTNDMRGHFRPYRFSDDVDLRDGDPLMSNRDYGGMAAYAGYVNRTRKEVEDKGGVVLLFDCGNTYISNAESLFFRGKAVVEMMNLMGYQAAIPGNLDYNEGTDLLRQLAKLSTFPWVTNHIFRKSDGRRADFLYPHVILDIKGLKVGVTGITYDSFRHLMKTSRIPDLQIVPPETELRPSVDALKESGAELIVMLSHGHPQLMSKFLDVAPDIHVAVNSWHVSLKESVGQDESRMIYYFMKRYRNTILSNWQDSHYTLGRIDFVFDRRNRTAHNERSAIIYLLSDSVEPDTRVAAVVDKYSRLYVELVAAKMHEVIGQATGDFSMDKRPDTFACTLGKLVMGSLREYTEADIAFLNFWGIRRVITKGPVTVKTVLDVIPFDNYAVTAKVQGKNLSKIGWMLHRSGRGAHWAGFDYQGAPGHVTAMTVSGVPVDPEKYYTIATSDFVTEEGGLPHAVDLKIWNVKMQDVLIEYIRKHKTISPDGRERVERFRF